MAYKGYMEDSTHWGYSNSDSTASSAPQSYSASQDVAAAARTITQAANYAVQVWAWERARLKDSCKEQGARSNEDALSARMGPPEEAPRVCYRR